MYQNTTDALGYIVARNGYAASDFFYIPTTQIDFFADLMQIFFEAGVFKGIAVLKFLAAVEHIVPPRTKVKLIPRRNLSDFSYFYHRDLIMLHPLKQSYLRDASFKQRYCTSVIRTFREMLLTVP
ncbi:unnamed protein product [Cylicocyclus nassatus]|uniref:Uncharacterized protein n=1 Tax=Cylicocyclus nassatus TaxID=53992 RepID=A0AA36GTF4_CYLNA|nr:unnamed protein product [Cylicocyclus nassatus]